MLGSFVCACLIFFQQTASAPALSWIDLAPLFSVPLGLTLDPLSRSMLFMVTGVGSLIHIYSLGYMGDDEGKSRYFAALSLFMFSMLGIVLANNFVMMFIFWELVGVSSYLLIGHWFERPAAAEAAKKAFITNRIGDFGFMLGILMVWAATGSLVFTDIAGAMTKFTSHPGYLTAAALLVFCGAVGKSAQFPLHVWLPDAMEGPTPVSALIHAATMVAAGVYMLVRVGFLIDASADRAPRHRLDRHHHRRAGRADGDAAERHQAHARLLHALATRLHGDGGRPRFGRSGDVPSFHSRGFQGAALPRRRLDHLHAPSRAGHLENGRHCETHCR